MSKKIPLHIHPIFWLVAALLGWINSWTLMGTLLWVIVILVSVLVHEYGHALTARAFGQNARIDLVAMGGVTTHTGKKLKLWQDFIVVLMGPTFGFLLCGATYLLRMWAGNIHPILLYLLTIFVWINLFWSIINLLPLLPLDGGQLLRIVMEGIFGHKGLRITLGIGIVLGVIASFFFFMIGQFLVGAIFLLLTFESVMAFKQVKGMSVDDQKPDLQEELKKAEQAYLLQRSDEAKNLFQDLLTKSKTGIIHHEAEERLALIFYQEGKVQEAYELLSKNPKELSKEARIIYHRLAFSQGEYQKALEVGGKCFQDLPQYDIAYINAMASAALKDSRAAIGWLHCAMSEGMPGVQQAIAKSEFDAIRQDPLFQSFLKSLEKPLA